VHQPIEPTPAPLPTLAQLEREYIRFVLGRTNGNKSKAAQLLGIDPSTLYRKLQRDAA